MEERERVGKSLATVTAAPRRQKPPGTLLRPNNKQINLSPLGSVVGEGCWGDEGVNPASVEGECELTQRTEDFPLDSSKLD